MAIGDFAHLRTGLNCHWLLLHAACITSNHCSEVAVEKYTNDCKELFEKYDVDKDLMIVQCIGNR